MKEFDRRHFIRGLGAALAWPGLEVLAKEPGSAGAAVTADGMPLRLAVIYKPNGVNPAKWAPQGEGKDWDLSPTLQPLADFRNEFQVLSGFEHKFGWGRLDGAGDHARANATFLTGVRPHKTGGADIRCGVSMDQVAARNIGGLTRFSSLELGCDGVRKSGVCDSGYSCAYQYNLSWASETLPMAPESNPRYVFERLFGVGTGRERVENLQRRQAQQRSILDFVLEDAKKLHGKLGRNDQQIPEEPAMIPPAGIPDGFREHLRLMFDLMTLAFETDSTRVITFLQSHDGSNRTFPEIGVNQGHHQLSHHRKKEDKLTQLAKIDRFYMEEFAYFLEKMRNRQDANGSSLLQNSMVLWGSGLRDPDRHQHDELPVILAGEGGGKLQPGLHRRVGRKVPMTNLFVRLLEEMGTPVESFGDSNGRVDAV